MIYFDVLISKKIKKKLILKYFQAKNYFEKYYFLFIKIKNIINKAFLLRRWRLQDKKDYWEILKNIMYNNFKYIFRYFLFYNSLFDIFFLQLKINYNIKIN